MFDEIKTWSMEQVEERKKAIVAEIEQADSEQLDKLNDELNAIEERKAALVVETRKADMLAVVNGAGKVIAEAPKKEKRTMGNVLESREYVDAYAEYIKTGDATEVRAVLTEMGVDPSGDSAGVPVPAVVEDRIRTAWEKDEVLSRVKRSNIKGILKIGFEISADPAVVHAEGDVAPDEEELNLGIVSLVPETLKKWITISDEAFDMKGQAFLDYIMDEIEYRIVKLAADTVIADIVGAPTAATKTAASVAHVETTGIADFINAVAALSDEARDLVIIMNKQSYAYYKGLAIAANYAIDPFDGIPVLFNNTLDSATDVPGSGDVNKIAIVGDLQGESVNFTAGYEPNIKVDDLSLAEKDLIKVVGRLPMGHGVTACGRFTVITKTGS